MSIYERVIQFRGHLSYHISYYSFMPISISIPSYFNAYAQFSQLHALCILLRYAYIFKYTHIYEFISKTNNLLPRYSS